MDTSLTAHMRVYHFVGEKHGIENLRRRRLKIATFAELNDPFELFGVEMSNEQIRRAFENMKRRLSQNRGILCFSESWANPVMWSHYANRHKGLCLGFDVPVEYIGKVHYSRKRLVGDLEKLSDVFSLSLDEARKFLFTKYAHWSYEKEYRSFVTLEERDHETGFYFADFSDRLKLRDVIVGARSIISRSDIRSVLGELAGDVEVFKTRLAFKTFRVVRQRDESLWG